MSETKRRVRVGAIIAVATIALAGTLVWLKGAALLFGGAATLEAEFDDVSGLVPGAAVRLAGMQVGSVTGVRLPSTAEKVVVRVSIAHEYLPRIRADSVATISTRGLLGDPLIEISLGSSTALPVHDGARLASAEPRGVDEMVSALEMGASNVEDISAMLRDRIDKLFTEQLATDLNRIAHSTADILENVEKGQGLAHAMIYDGKLAAHARSALVRLDRAVRSAERIVGEVETGDGFAHAAIYDDRAGDALAELAGALEEAHALMGDVRKGSGGEGIGQDLRAAAQTLRKILDEVDRGKGTIGGLIKDPTVYQDLKELLGEVRRNVILRSIVRMTIAKDHLDRK